MLRAIQGVDKSQIAIAIPMLVVCKQCENQHATRVGGGHFECQWWDGPLSRTVIVKAIGNVKVRHRANM